MTWWSYPCSCAVWVQANRCAGNTSNLRVFVHENDLPASLQWFAYDSSSSQRNCWSIDPAGLRVCLPRDDDVHIARPSDLYSDCTTCEALPEIPDSPGGPPGSSPPGGGGGGGGGGGEPGQPPDVPDPKGIKVSVCADHLARAQARGWPTDKLYVYAKDELASASVIQVAGICIDIPTGPLVTPPADALWFGLGQNFDSCSDCTDGVQAVLCAADANLPGAENAPELWIRNPDLAEVGSGFAYGVWCYNVPTGPIVTIPENARIYKPTRELDCASCNRGVRYERCPGEPDPGVEYWADAEEITRLLSDLPTLAYIYIRIAGVCYSLDLAATPQRVRRLPMHPVMFCPQWAWRLHEFKGPLGGRGATVHQTQIGQQWSRRSTGCFNYKPRIYRLLNSGQYTTQHRASACGLSRSCSNPLRLPLAVQRL